MGFMSVLASNFWFVFMGYSDVISGVGASFGGLCYTWIVIIFCTGSIFTKRIVMGWLPWYSSSNLSGDFASKKNEKATR
ncbi:MAG: hypothetical protein Q8N02_07740 [Methylotenera sp.]|nr:hypothetical protein [Methylotenera sp.]MDO9233939.1 hypothetical protein [Methylotenera sp.]MDO9388869.1 hypothetical protein [Methylotenera sp.]MDP2102701.1 hypothetical protein [Methylotenera sp.]MDP2282341.1 hypothetical protein [Methylotenera sp.]